MYCPKIYTDASLRLGKVGIGVYFDDRDYERAISKRVMNKMDNNAAEMLCILYVLHITPIDVPIEVLTDSQSSLTMIENEFHHKKIKPHLHRVVAKTITQTLARRTTPTWFTKVKAHSGDYGNDIADRLAKLGTQIPADNTNDTEYLMLANNHCITLLS